MFNTVNLYFDDVLIIKTFGKYLQRPMSSLRTDGKNR